MCPSQISGLTKGWGCQLRHGTALCRVYRPDNGRSVAAGPVLTEVGAITGSAVLATRKRLSFAGEPLCDGPGEALTQRQSGTLQLRGGSGLRRLLPKVLRSEAAEVPGEQELRLTARMAAGEGSDKVLWLDAAVPGLAISTPKASACTAMHKPRLGDPVICSAAPILGSSRRATSSAPCSAPRCCSSSSVFRRAVCSASSCDAATGGGCVQAGARPRLHLAARRRQQRAEDAGTAGGRHSGSRHREQRS